MARRHASRPRDRFAQRSYQSCVSADFGLYLTKHHLLFLETVRPDTNSRDAQVESGSGIGHRVGWESAAWEGLRFRSGYLDLSTGYNALVSDPGNQITTNTRGREMSVDYSVPALGSTVDNLRVAAQAFLYNAKAGADDID